MPKESLPATYFDELYQSNEDPWNFEGSDYEREKYTETLKALPRPVYDNAFEIGCSIGVLTQRLAQRCRQLLSVDASEVPLQKARERLKDQPHVQLKSMSVPAEFPEGPFDLILVSEVGYYWSPDDLVKAQQQILHALSPGGHLLLVHWTPFVDDYPLTGDEVHEAFHKFAESGHRLKHIYHQRAEQYRLDLWEAQ
uniref:Class I SAM-dependent methyltransferase n=1 Tax=Roseihalotalea indica TaxID=2867963 RepID=A0AA49GL81_9BACT|nr:class I SAM-dependent methyltransferase [Tunicatimonas sp. TK19036]